MKYVVVICAALVAGPVAAQPFSKSMAECAGLYAFGRDHIENDQTAYLLEFGQAKWMNAAIVQAQSEGIADPAPYVDAAMTAKYAAWQARGVMAVFSQEFGDWMDYCRSFARAQDVDLDPT